MAIAIMLLAFPALTFLLNAQSDNFDDGNDIGWTHYDPIGTIPQAGGPQAAFTLTNGAYRIRASSSLPVSAVGPARAGSLRQDVTYTDFYVAVDLVKWDDTVRQAFGILARVSAPGVQSTKGYAFTYDRGSGVTSTSGGLDISWIGGESPHGVRSSSIHLDPTKQYRFVFIGIGQNLEGRVYELPNITTPRISIMGTDTNYASGTSGLVVYNNNGSGSPINPDATFDNYFATIQEPPVPPTLSYQLNGFGEFILTWPASPSGFHLQSSPIFGPASWTTITDGVSQFGDNYQYTDFPVEGIKFFRLMK